MELVVLTIVVVVAVVLVMLVTTDHRRAMAQVEMAARRMTVAPVMEDRTADQMAQVEQAMAMRREAEATTRATVRRVMAEAKAQTPVVVTAPKTATGTEWTTTPAIAEIQTERPQAKTEWAYKGDSDVK